MTGIRNIFCALPTFTTSLKAARSMLAVLAGVPLTMQHTQIAGQATTSVITM
jgi:hypothetical protein